MKITQVVNFLVNGFVNYRDILVHKGSGFCPSPEERTLTRKLVIIISHVLLLGPITRQLQIISLGREEQEERISEKADNQNIVYMKRKYYERDLAYLNMIDSFTQDAPQLLLQVNTVF